MSLELCKLTHQLHICGYSQLFPNWLKVGRKKEFSTSTRQNNTTPVSVTTMHMMGSIPGYRTSYIWST
jgi:hypothetical protein